jgi:hypothetical protein
VACPPFELLDSAWFRKVHGDDQRLYTVCRGEIAGDRFQPIAVSRAERDVDGASGKLGGHRLADPTACPGDQRPWSISATKQFAATVISLRQARIHQSRRHRR